MDKKTEKKEISPIEQLLDENNNDNIILYNEKDKPFEFEQIAIIPLDKKLYAILRPVAKLDGIADDEAITFEVSKEYNSISVVLDDEVINKVFEVYKKLLDEDDKDKKN